MSETMQPLVDALFPYIGYLIPLPIIILDLFPRAQCAAPNRIFLAAYNGGSQRHVDPHCGF